MDFNRLTPSESYFARVMYNFFEFHKNITSKTGNKFYIIYKVYHNHY